MLQSEKVIRTRSLINQRFQDVRNKGDISSVSNLSETESDADLLSERLNFQMENVQFHMEIQREDLSIIYYVTGVISPTILKRAKCDVSNAWVLETWKLELQIVRTSRQEFISKLSRDGHLNPSDVVYITCIHAFVFYPSIRVPCKNTPGLCWIYKVRCWYT